jgi:hypothetical protein
MQNSIDMWVDRQPHMSVAEHQLRLVIVAATWLSRHLGGRIPIKILAVDEAEAADLQRLMEHAEANATVTLSTLATYVVETWSQGPSPLYHFHGPKRGTHLQPLMFDSSLLACETADQETLELYQALAEAQLQGPQDGAQTEGSSEFGYT